MKKVFFAATFALICLQANAQGFLFGYVMGSTTSSNNSSAGTGDTTLIYKAPDAVMATVSDVMSVRVVNAEICPGSAYPGLSLGQIFSMATEKAPPGKKTVLQISRIVDGAHVSCASFWFSYVYTM